MPNPPDKPKSKKSADSAKSATSEWTAQEVIEMFADLGLPVCDDDQAIKEAVEDQRPRRLRETNSPDPRVREAAKRWFKNVDLMQNRRPELLQVVNEHFARLADASLKGAIAQGLKKLTQPLMDDLLRIACEDCRVDSKLAERFLENYMKLEKLELDEGIVRPALVEDLKATSGLSQISINWSIPLEKFDEVEIVREVISPTPGEESAVDVGTPIFKGRESSIFDKGVSPGTWYAYRAYSIHQGIPSAIFAETRAICLGEVRKAKASWQEGRMCLTWELPGDDVSVLIFRRVGTAPKIKPGSENPKPANRSTKCVYRGGGTSWEDTDLTEGAIHYYLVVADFGQGLFTKGKVVQAGVPKPPPAVPNLTSTYSSKGKDTVNLEWDPAPGDAPVEYVVVRREGDAPPAQIEDGAQLATIKQVRFMDEQVVAGRRYVYAVFTYDGELYSRKGTASSPVDILADVMGLQAKEGDGTVELDWETPPNVSEVIVRRSLGEPRDHTGGALVKLTGMGHALDSGLRNGRRYHYLVCCLYRPSGDTEVVSSGVRTSAIPIRLPDQVEEFEAQAQGLEALFTWAPPAYGQAVIVRSAEPHKLPLGHRLTADEVTAFGERIHTKEGGRAEDKAPDINKPYYSIFTIARSHAVAGGTTTFVVIPDVTDLTWLATRDGITLRWLWPPDCKAVRVVRRSGAWPEGPDDPLAVCTPFSRHEYRTAGEKFLDKIEADEGEFHYVIYAQASGAAGKFFAPGVEPGCQVVIPWKRWMTMYYQLSSPRRGPHKGKDIRLVWNLEAPFPDFAGFVLVANQERVPQSLTDGVELFRWTPEPGQVDGDHEDWVSLALVQQRRWARFFCKAMVLDADQGQSMLIVHPNTALPFSETGEVENSETDDSLNRYQAGVPKTVICPYCFDEFPLGKMRFTSYSGGAIVQARYSWLHRLLRRPLKIPIDSQGRRLTRKLCPHDNDHDLPFTAGSQASLVIGVIGAKYSGKSHYVASLVERLESRTGADMRASLLPVTDETSTRYQHDFYDPLFAKSLELPVTVGVPPPLIYDLTLDESLFGEKRNRAVTLALYDTAGEELENPDRVREVVKYLGCASGIMFLVDPLQVPEVRELLPPSVQPPELERNAAPQQIISNVLQLLEDGEIVATNAPLSIPVAVVLTKCDVLRDAGLIEANRLWNIEKRHIGYFDVKAHEDMNSMMGEYLQRWSMATFRHVETRFSRHAFFGVSATGCASEKSRFEFISPWRVEDPLLWLLAELGVVPTR